MATPARDIVTKQIDPFVLPGIASRIVDLQIDPRGGYFALLDITPNLQSESKAYILKLDAAHRLVVSFPISVLHLPAPRPSLFQMTVAGMSVDASGIYVVGTVSSDGPGPLTTLFVTKFSLDGAPMWVNVYVPRLFDGCRIPQRVQAFGHSIVRLAPPDDGRLMVLLRTAVIFDGNETPRPDDSIAAGIFTIDNDGTVTSQLTRLFGRGQVMPSRLRVLPTFGPTIVGQTRDVWPVVGKWSGYWARVDRDGNPLFETGYDLGSDTVVNDVAENEEGVVLAVGTFEKRIAVALRLNDVGNLRWLATYTPPVGSEFFASELHVLQASREGFIAGGNIMNDLGLTRPWLLRLDTNVPEPMWQKQYVVDPVQSPLPTSFDALMFTTPDVIVAGGDIFRRSGARVDRLPFLAVSETAPGAGPSACSVETSATTSSLTGSQFFGSLWMDRMPMDATEWTVGTSLSGILEEPLCGGSSPP